MPYLITFSFSMSFRFKKSPKGSRYTNHHIMMMLWVLFVGYTIPRHLSTTSHPLNRTGRYISCYITVCSLIILCLMEGVSTDQLLLVTY